MRHNLKLSVMGGVVMGAIAAAFLSQDHGIVVGGLVGAGIGALVALITGMLGGGWGTNQR